MRTVKKIKFTGFPEYHNPREQAYYRYLAERYDIVESDNPDYVIDGGQSFEHVKYDAVKILISSENDVPDFNSYDYAIGSAPLQFDDRYLRMPWCSFSPHYRLLDGAPSQSPEKLLSRKFCSFVVSNAEFGDPLRVKFFHELSKYKQVDSGGRFMNNIGGPIKDKDAFCSGYKFNIAFENSSCLGYVTEKIVDAFHANSVPIYYGNPSVTVDFREESMVRVKGEDDFERAISEIIRLDKDDDEYLKVVNTRPLPEHRGSSDCFNELTRFLSAIFDQPLSTAHRLCPFGHQAMMRRHLGYLHGLDYKIGKSWAYRAAIGIIGRIRSARAGAKALKE